MFQGDLAVFYEVLENFRGVLGDLRRIRGELLDALEAPGAFHDFIKGFRGEKSCSRDLRGFQRRFRVDPRNLRGSTDGIQHWSCD